MPVAKPVSSDARVIAHVDMDCFYVQVEQRKKPELRGKPTAVVQYNTWKGGGLIAVSYEARKHGVKRSMRGDEAKKVCPDIQLVQVPVAREKADLSIYRDASSEVVSILAGKGRCERASIDEVYLDLTGAAEAMLAESPPECLQSIDDEALKSHVLGLIQEGVDTKENIRNWLSRSDTDRNDKLLACGAIIVAELRAQVLKETEFTCSAGIAHNKMLAKLASGMNKPSQQTVVPLASVMELLGSLPIKKMKQLGGKLGDSLQSDLGVKTVGDLLQFSESKLQECYGINTGTWLWNIARGISGEEVEGRILPKSHGSGKTFPGSRALRNLQSVEHWLNELCEELNERLFADFTQNKRVARTLTLHASACMLADRDSLKKFPSKSCPLRYGSAKIQEDALILFQAGLRKFLDLFGSVTDKNQNSGWAITGLSVSAGNIVAKPPGSCSIMKFFKAQNSGSSASVEGYNNEALQDTTLLSTSGNYMDSGNEESTKVEKSQFIQTHVDAELDSHCTLQNNQKERGLILSWNQKQPQACSSSSHSPVQELSCSSRPGENQDIMPFSQDQLGTFTQQKKLKKRVKEAGSILNFFRGNGSFCSQSNTGESGRPSSSAFNHAAVNRQVDQQAERWSINPADIDPAVIDELPADIQAEVRNWLGPSFKQPRSSSQKQGITRYFLPARRS